MDNAENILLLAHLAREDKLLQEALKRTAGRQLFDNVKDPVSAFIWSVLSDTRRAAGTMPTRTLVETECALRLKQLGGSQQDIGEGVMQVVGDIWSFESDQIREKIGRMYLDTAMSEILHMDWSKRVRGLQDMGAMRKFVQEAARDMAASAQGGSSRDKPLMNLPKYLVNKEREPTGMLFLDTFIGGGIAGGEVMGVLGGTGGGKTVMATQLMGECAMRDRHCLLLQYEQGTEGDITERICCYITGLGIGEFRDKTPGQQTEDTQARLKKAVDKWGRYITVVDLHGPEAGLGGPEEVISHIEDAIRDGDKPNLVLIDWLGAMIDKNIAAKGLDTKDYIHIAPGFMRVIKSYCEGKGIRLVVFHQLSTEAQAKPPSYKPQPSDAYNFKSFSYYTDLMLQIGKLAQNNVAHLISGKHRRGARPEQLVVLDGEHQKFSSAGGDYVIDHRKQFVKADAAAQDVHDRKEDIKRAYANQCSTL